MERRKNKGMVMLWILVAGGLVLLQTWLGTTAQYRQVQLFSGAKAGIETTAPSFQHAIMRQAVQPTMPEPLMAKGSRSPKRIFKQLSLTTRTADSGQTKTTLQLRLTNPGTSLIEQVQVEVLYHYTGGRVAQRIIPVERLQPASTILLQVPSCPAASRVSYRVLNIYVPAQPTRQKTI